MKKITIGILAHVDAGKTTLSEALLYETGAIRKWGRVDHGDAFLDTDVQEKERGITIFSKQAEMEHHDTRFMLLDTPGHIDFSAEMERTLQVLDHAVLVISGNEGVQGHTATLWKLLDKYRIPVFIFINKTDLSGTDAGSVMKELKDKLDDRCVSFSREKDEAFYDEIAMCDEDLMEEVIDTGSAGDEEIGRAIAARHIFPCFSGSALRKEGITEFMDALADLCMEGDHPDEFGAVVYKITRDSQGTRLTHMKITGGSLHVKDTAGEEKVEQIRIYSGDRYRTRDAAYPGDICAVTGLKDTYAGQGLGYELDAAGPVMESVMLYSVILPDGTDSRKALDDLKLLQEEDPQLHVVWNPGTRTIQMQLMGEVQTEILGKMIYDRFGYQVEFGQGNIAYRETIADTVTGSGHFEPLRHYAEVHLMLEPGERGSGLTFYSACSEDVLDRNWQRLILTHLAEKEHAGVLTGSPVTDMKITILSGRAHLKHTVGGDFRQATYRALRQGLRKARSILLEPWYEFRLTIPSRMIGRAMSDMQRMSGIADEPVISGGEAVITGRVPVSEVKDYAVEVASYTKGHGVFSCSLYGYEPCHDQEAAVSASGYDPDRDTGNTADSVFCGNGAGFNVKWDKADGYMHVKNDFFPGADRSERRDQYVLTEDFDTLYQTAAPRNTGKKRRLIPKREIVSETGEVRKKTTQIREEYLLVDGYNIIFSWKDLNALAKVNMDAARQALIEILANYQGYRRCRIIAVFDAYRVKGGERHFEKYAGVDIVYTREAETADMYIEKTAYRKSGSCHVRVATSDRLEQMIITGNGAFRISAEDFLKEIESTRIEIEGFIKKNNMKNRQKHRNGIKIPGR